jgi:hypothetical protein
MLPGRSRPGARRAYRRSEPRPLCREADPGDGFALMDGWRSRRIIEPKGGGMTIFFATIAIVAALVVVLVVARNRRDV